VDAADETAKPQHTKAFTQSHPKLMNKTRFVRNEKLASPTKSLERQPLSKTIMSSTATISPYLFQT
jgi:hypothetical protein